MSKKKASAGGAPRSASTALLIIDVISDFEFEDGNKLLSQTASVAGSIAKLRKRAKRSGVAVIYANDNFGKWQEDFKTFVGELSKPGAKGREIVDALKPDADDYYVLKPHRSAFYFTSLTPLLDTLGVKKLVITGITTDICVLFTANDAYMRGFELFVPSDCVAAVEDEHNRQALGFIRRVLKADTRSSDKLRFDRL